MKMPKLGKEVCTISSLVSLRRIIYNEHILIQWGSDTNLQLFCNYECFPYSIRLRFLFSNNLGSVDAFVYGGHEEDPFT